MGPLVRRNPALFMPHVPSSSRAPPSFCVMNSVPAPRPLRELPACVWDEESFLRHKTGGPVPQLPPAAPRSPASESQSFFPFPFSPSLPSWFLSSTSLQSYHVSPPPPPAPSLPLFHPPHPPQPLQERKRERESEGGRAGERRVRLNVNDMSTVSL